MSPFSTAAASSVSRRAALAELAFVALLVASGSFSPTRLLLLLLVASASLWNRDLGWGHLGLRRPAHLASTFAVGVVGAAAILVAVPTMIVPFATWVSQMPIDLSALGDLRESNTLWLLLGHAWTLAAIGEEMAFRGYVIGRIIDVVGVSRPALASAVAVSSLLFGLAHGYQGTAGMIAAGLTGGLVALIYLHDRQNLWAVIICHGLVDSIALSLIYFEYESLLFPRDSLIL